MKRELSFLLLVASGLSGCGDRDASPADTSASNTASARPPTAPAPTVIAVPAPAEFQGVFAGTSNSGVDVVTVQLDDGSVFAMQGRTVNSVFTPNGFVRATGRYANAIFTQVQNAVLYPYNAGLVPGSLSGSYTPGGAFNWSFTTIGRTSQWTTAKLPSESYDYDHAASLADVSGNWSSRTFNKDVSATLAVSPTGEITGGDFYGCRFSGVATPRPGGKNVFNISVTAEDSRCDLASEATGVGVILQVSSTSREFVFAVSESGSAGIVWSGVR